MQFWDGLLCLGDTFTPLNKIQSWRPSSKLLTVQTAGGINDSYECF